MSCLNFGTRYGSNLKYSKDFKFQIPKIPRKGFQIPKIPRIPNSKFQVPNFGNLKSSEFEILGI
jgi:hypothetical protein